MKHFEKTAFGLAFALGIVAACSSPPKSHSPSTSEENGTLAGHVRPSALSREAAANRSKQISKVSYQLWFGLSRKENKYDGRTVIRFDLKPKAKDLGQDIFIDFAEGELKSLLINGTSITDLTSPSRYDGQKLFFKLGELQPTGNKVEIAFWHPYSQNGRGLHRFEDPADGRVYLYSNFEPYDAHRMFPCFDQPDLKASFELTVDSPDEWQVVSNTLPKEVADGDPGRKNWIFPPSPVFSTYVFALHAGPYAVWKGNAAGIPIRLMSRRSMSKYVDHDEWLSVTRKGLDFYATQFGYPYPFSKYDQIIVPDFNAGAMENVGAVTFSERYVYRTRVTRDQHRRRAGTILHEMAHMWFGDLVTMKWWNGLWLNESFATFMASWAVDQATEFKGQWQSFYAGSKEGAYWADQLVTTHPIEQNVPDTDHAAANFDEITYGKGASVLKQLSYFLGEDDFREGLQRYFQKFAYRNTTLIDFMRMLAEASSQDLIKWQHAWLQTSGVNTLRADWACEVDEHSGKSRVSKFTLVQSPSKTENSSPELRPHKTEVAFFYFPKRGNPRTSLLYPESKTFSVSYSEAETPVLEALRKPCPDFVFPNFNDYDYVKTELDPVSLEIATHHLAQIEHVFTRQMLWNTLWEMVIDGKLPAQAYANAVLTQAPAEKDTQILGKVLSRLVSPRAATPTVLKFLTGPVHDKYQTRIENFLRSHLQRAPSGSDLQLVWFEGFLAAARSKSSLHYLHNLLDDRVKLAGFDMDQDRRWQVVQRLSSRGGTDAKRTQAMIAQELESDSTDNGQKAAIIADVSIPDAMNKKEWLDKILTGALPVPKLKEAMRSFYGVDQEETTQQGAEPYFDHILKLSALAALGMPITAPDPLPTSTPTAQTGEEAAPRPFVPPTLAALAADDEYLGSFASGMFPPFCTTALAAQAGDIVDHHPEITAPVVKAMRIARQEAERCVAARKRSAEAVASHPLPAEEPAEEAKDPGPKPEAQATPGSDPSPVPSSDVKQPSVAP